MANVLENKDLNKIEESLRRALLYMTIFNEENAGDYGDDTKAYCVLDRDIKNICDLLEIDYKSYNNKDEVKSVDVLYNQLLDVEMSKTEAEDLLSYWLDEEEVKEWLEDFESEGE